MQLPLFSPFANAQNLQAFKKLNFIIWFWPQNESLKLHTLHCRGNFSINSLAAKVDQGLQKDIRPCKQMLSSFH